MRIQIANEAGEYPVDEDGRFAGTTIICNDEAFLNSVYGVGNWRREVLPEPDEGE